MTEYQKYQLQWMIDHDYSLSKLMKELTKVQFLTEEETSVLCLFDLFVLYHGFEDKYIWASKEEWEGNEKNDEI